MGKRSREASDDSLPLPVDPNSTAEPGLSASVEATPTAHTPKYVELEPQMDETSSRMQCLLPPHPPLEFAGTGAYEAHYNQSHTNRCRECRRNFPSTHFLHLHIAENHDPIAAARRAKGEKIFLCFVEDCGKLCSDWTKRRSHLVDKHGFPKNYDFFVVSNGIDGRRSMLRPGVDAQGHRRSSRERERSNSTATQTTQSTAATSVGSSAEADSQSGKEMSEALEAQPPKSPTRGHASSIDELTEAMTSLKFVPSSITFGKRKARSGLAKS